MARMRLDLDPAIRDERLAEMTTAANNCRTYGHNDDLPTLPTPKRRAELLAEGHLEEVFTCERCGYTRGRVLDA
jgi:hypothetical protein